MTDASSATKAPPETKAAPETHVVRREDGPHRGRYVAIVDGHESELTYERSGGRRITIDHTSVPSVLSGRGVGQALLARAVEDARKERVKIVPACSFAAAQIAKRPEWHDVLEG